MPSELRLRVRVSHEVLEQIPQRDTRAQARGQKEQAGCFALQVEHLGWRDMLYRPIAPQGHATIPQV